MTTLKSFIEAIEYKITGGSEFQWKCFGDNARYMDCQDKEGAGGAYSISAVFDSVDQTVYLIEAWDYVLDREYRWINPEYQKAHKKYSKKMDVVHDETMDGRKYIDLELAEDILEKINALVNDRPYDERVKVPVDFSDEELLKYMKLAHEMDITFNQLVEQALRHAIDEVKAGRLTKEDAEAFVEDHYSEI